ncbi:MAG: N-acetylmuramoyl-L-alanine amidase [Caulobacter sp.]|nr:N-acetylmuramoyl-L-alanine amidase [Caulobacter sp.]
MSGRGGITKRWLGAIAALVFGVATAGLSAPRDGGPEGVLKVRFGGDQSETRMVIDLDRSVSARMVSDASGGRQIELVLPRVDAAPDLQGSGHGLVSRWSIEPAPGGAKVRIDLSRDGQVSRRFLLPPGDGVGNYRYVIDLKATGETAMLRQGAPAPAPSLRPMPLSVSSDPIHLKKVIVIDAGHGGHDPGASGARTFEKDVTLAAAKALKVRLERTGRYRVVLTRETDTFVPLESRVQIARQANADLFISLHADSGPNADTHGVSAYTLSEKGTGRVARVLGRNDWYMRTSGPGGDRAVNQILLDLSQRATKNRSASFAEMVLDRISLQTPLLQRSHRDAGFIVLLAPDVPAVLLEMGFLTNPGDERGLNDPGKRGRMMDAVAASIDAWFGQDTRVASR